MKIIKRTLAIILAISILAIANVIPVSATSTSFTDVKTTSWYYGYVNKLINLKITAGIGNNKYGPDNSVTNAEFVTFLCKANGLKQEDGYTYTDTQKHWASRWISAAVTANIIDQGATFNPNKAITRQEAVEMLCRSLGLQEDTTMTTPYIDVKSNAGYSNTAYKEYLMQGSVEKDGRYFKPASSITRAETAAVIVNLVDYKTNAESYKAGKKTEIAQKEQKENDAKTDAEKYKEWLNGMDRGVNKALLTNTTLLGKGTLQALNAQVLKDLAENKWPGWTQLTGIKPEHFADEFVRVGRKAVDLWSNSSYNELGILRTDWSDVMSTNFLDNSLETNINKIVKNTWIREGTFYTGKSLLVYNSVGQPELRGTVRYRWISPSKMSGTDKVNVWYEEEIAIDFFPESTGLKSNGFWTQISDTRIVK